MTTRYDTPPSPNGSRPESPDPQLNTLGKVFADHTGTCSGICRQIVFALFAVIGATSYRDGIFDFTWGAWIVLGLLIFYLLADVGQYLYAALASERQAHRLELIQALICADPPRKTPADYDQASRKGNRKISRITRRMFLLKIILLGFAFLFLLLTLGQRLSRQASAPAATAETVTATHAVDFVKPACETHAA